MTYRITHVGDPAEWAELRGCLGGVEMRSSTYPTWSLWSNVKTLEECADQYRNNPNYFVTTQPDGISYAGVYKAATRHGSGRIKIDYAYDTPVAAQHKCTCPWDGPNGVYAKGCSCGGV